LKLPEVFAQVRPAHAASIRVLEKRECLMGDGAPGRNRTGTPCGGGF
jgi:hypothetical protein